MLSLTLLRHNKTILNSLQIGKSQCLNHSFRSIINYRHNPVPKTISTPLLTSQKIFRTLKPLQKNLIARVHTEIVSRPKKVVGYWFFGCSAMVFGAVLLGGITRLTESGLSMVTWRLMGEKMPKTYNDWLVEFKKYQEYPEYKLLKRDITLNEFKMIWMMEYAHRTWGRLIGAAFYLPAAYFWMKGYLTRPYKLRVCAFGLLIAAQGLMGWYMVKSGLEDRFHKETDIPRVSQYRLAAHLSLALLLYAGTLYSALDIVYPLSVVAIHSNMGTLTKLARYSKGLIFLTVISGAFVAGLDAGLVYNSFPKMGESWIPDEILSMSPVFKNFTENPVTVQFDHRILGMTTLGVITLLWLLAHKAPIPQRTKKIVNGLACMGVVQVLLGISTLMNYVPTVLAACHQCGSLVLMGFAISLMHNLKCLKYMPK